MFQKIVVALDGSELSKKALEAAIQLAKDQKSLLHLLHVLKEIVVPPYVGGEVSYLPSDYYDEMNEILRKDGEELLKQGAAQAEKEGVTVRKIMIHGDPAREIVDYVKENGIQLVVMGSRGLGTVKEIMLGSVSHKVSQLSTSPVLIIK